MEEENGKGEEGKEEEKEEAGSSTGNKNIPKYPCNCKLLFQDKPKDKVEMMQVMEEQSIPQLESTTLRKNIGDQKTTWGMKISREGPPGRRSPPGEEVSHRPETKQHMLKTGKYDNHTEKSPGRRQ